MTTVAVADQSNNVEMVTATSFSDWKREAGSRAAFASSIPDPVIVQFKTDFLALPPGDFRGERLDRVKLPCCMGEAFRVV